MNLEANEDCQGLRRIIDHRSLLSANKRMWAGFRLSGARFVALFDD